jgi:hypothetical protein
VQKVIFLSRLMLMETAAELLAKSPPNYASPNF